MSERSVAFVSLPMAILLPIIAGCASWKETPESKPVLSTPKAGASVAIVDIAFIPLPFHDNAVDWRLWNEADEQCLSDQLRTQLAANGLRVGTISGDLPAIIRDEMDLAPPLDSLALLQQADLLSDAAHGQRRIHCRLGVKYELPVRNQMRGEVSLLVRDGESLIGDRVSDPLFQFSMEVVRGHDGETLLRLVPEVQHGNTKQSWVSGEQAMRLEARRESNVMDHLALEIPLTSGAVALISPTTEPIGLGEKMFTGERVDGKQEVIALALRLYQEPSAL